MKEKLISNDIFFIGILLILVLIFFSQSMFSNKIFLLRDTYCDFYSWRYFAKESISKGIIPLWNPYSSCGQPFIANPQSAVFYPLNLLFYILPLSIALKLFIILHIFLAGLFMYILMRGWKIERIASLIAATVFMFNSFIITRIEFLSMLSGVIWIPLVFYFLNKAIEKRSLGYTLVLSVTLAIQLLSGHTEPLFYTLLGAVLFSIFKIREMTPRIKLISSSLILPLACVIALLLVMVQLLPTYELIPYSIRSGGIDPGLDAGSLHPIQLVSLLTPYLYGQPAYPDSYWGISIFEFWLGSFYIGILPLFFIGISIVSIFFQSNEKSETDKFLKSGKTLFFFLMTLMMLSLILAFGKYTPIFALFYKYVPLFNKFRWPAKIMYLFVFSSTILSGIGAHYFFKTIRDNVIEWKKRISCFLKIVFACDLVLILGFIISYFDPTIISLLTERSFEISNPKYADILRDYLRMLIFLNAGLLLLWLGIKRKIGLCVAKILVVVLIVSNLFIISLNINFIAEDKIYDKKPESIKVLENDPGLYRVFSSYHMVQQFLYGCRDPELFLWAKSALVGETSLPHYIFKIWGGGTLRINRYCRLYSLLCSNEISENTRNKLFDLLNIRYVIMGEHPLEVLFVKGKREIQLMENKDFLPRAFVVNQAIILSDENAILNRLFSKEFDPRREIILERNIDKLGKKYMGPRNFTYHINDIKYENNKVAINLTLNNNGFLVLSDTYFPGWKVYIDGQEGRIYRADYIFRAVALTEGNHLVKFVYEPLSFKIGAWISLLTLLGLIGLSIFALYRKLHLKLKNKKMPNKENWK